MNRLAQVFVFKIAATVLFWCVPLVLFPSAWLQAAGLPLEGGTQFLRMLGWAYLALCVGYAFGLKAALQGVVAEGPVWVGIVSNGGACAYLLYFGLTGGWAEWGGFVQFVLWSSVAATAAITLGLYRYGVSAPPAAPARAL